MVRLCITLLTGFIFLLAMHLVLYNGGGSGSDMPDSLLVWSIILFFLAGVFCFLLRHRFYYSPELIIILFGGGVMTIPWFWSPSTEWQMDAFPRIGGLWTGVTLYFLFRYCGMTERQQNLLLTFIILAVVFQSLFSLAGLYRPGLLPTVSQAVLQQDPGAVGVAQQRNVTASFLATGAGLLFWFMTESRIRISIPLLEYMRRAAIFLALILVSGLLIAIKSRSGWLGGIIVISGLSGVSLLSAKKMAPGRKSALGALAAILIITAGLMMTRGFSQALHEHVLSDAIRYIILKETWSMITVHPWEGWGYGGFTWNFAHYISAGSSAWVQEYGVVTHPHNEILFWWVEGGILPLAGLMILVVGVIRPVLVSMGRRRLSLLICTSPIVLHCLTEYPCYQSPVHLLILSLLLGFAASDTQPARERTGKAARFFLPAFAMMVIASMGGILVLYQFYQNQIITDFRIHSQNEITHIQQLKNTGIGTEELLLCQAQSWIVHYQMAREGEKNLQDLQKFRSLALFWLDTWIDVDMYSNLINVDEYLGNQREAMALKSEAHRLFPWDNRFFVATEPFPRG